MRFKIKRVQEEMNFFIQISERMENINMNNKIMAFLHVFSLHRPL